MIAAIVETIARAILAPAAVLVLDFAEPMHRAPDRAMVVRQPGGVQACERRPSAVDVVDTPASEPTAIGQLRVTQKLDSPVYGRMVGRLAELRQHADAATADIVGRRIEKCAVIGEGNVVQIIIDVVG